MEKLSGSEQRPRAQRAQVEGGAAQRPQVDLAGAQAAIEAFLTAIGHPASGNAELSETGRLVATAFHEELLSGYRMDPSKILRDSVADAQGELVVVSDIDVTCMCPHHLLPASGVVHIGYVPGGKVVGLGAISRLAECFSRRLILQETLCEEIAQALVIHAGAKGAACVSDLSPACLTARGKRPAHARVRTYATSGVLRDDAALRAEFLALINPPALRGSNAAGTR